ncbi:unnamed protein product [Symbiodinium pilosum]|uniref:Tyrosine specific protein phosphatases domain-containing protein n=1 Tax=Symbiodinium pilosum TaxID=2952 RepID=A0A812U638_SYMPI|nr:unnamed protein product [Symbiodinium pilosum]
MRHLSGLPKFTHLCNAASQAVPLTLDERAEDVAYLDLEMRDEEGMQPGTGTWRWTCQSLLRAVAFVDSAVLSGGTVLVNCFAGMNRSGAILLSWLLMHRNDGKKSLGFTAEGATSYLRSLEPFALNNQSLLECALAVAMGDEQWLAPSVQETWILKVPERPVGAPSKGVVEEVEEVEAAELVPLF